MIFRKSTDWSNGWRGMSETSCGTSVEAYYLPCSYTCVRLSRTAERHV